MPTEMIPVDFPLDWEVGYTILPFRIALHNLV
jgi:hypothetical protein